MKEARSRKPCVDQRLHPLPVEVGTLATPGENPMPTACNLGPEEYQRPKVGRDRVVVEVASHDVPQPLPLHGDRQVHAPTHLRVNHLELRPQAVMPGFPCQLEFSPAGLAADEGKAQEVEGLRLAEPACLAVSRRKAAELDEPGLLGM
jgi:hypothetical protein